MNIFDRWMALHCLFLRPFLKQIRLYSSKSFIHCTLWPGKTGHFPSLVRKSRDACLPLVSAFPVHQLTLFEAKVYSHSRFWAMCEKHSAKLSRRVLPLPYGTVCHIITKCLWSILIAWSGFSFSAAILPVSIKRASCWLRSKASSFVSVCPF